MTVLTQKLYKSRGIRKRLILAKDCKQSAAFMRVCLYKLAHTAYTQEWQGLWTEAHLANLVCVSERSSGPDG